MRTADHMPRVHVPLSANHMPRVPVPLSALRALAWALTAAVAIGGPALLAATAHAESCTGLATRFDAVLAAAPGCAAPTDCACYPDLRIDGKLAVSDKATAIQATELSNRYRQQQCPTIYRSTAGPAKCEPRCVDGACR